MESLTQVQILDNAVGVLLCANLLERREKWNYQKNTTDFLVLVTNLEEKI